MAKSSEGRLIILRKIMRIFIYYSKKKKDTLHAFIFGHDSISEFAEYTKDYLNISLFIILQ